MKIFKNFLVFLFTIVAIFFGASVLNSQMVFASVPQIAECKLNNLNQNVTFNPNNSTLSIDVLTDQPVKFNTISICQESDSVCSRTTAVKYFTYTSSYLETVNKVWDGKTGGSSSTLVSDGTYKIRATLANQGGESNTPGEYCSVNISVDLADIVSGTDGDSDEISTTTTATATATTTATTTPISRSGGSTVYSVHYIQEDLSNYEPINVFEVSAGRDRLAYVDLPLNFEAKHKISKDLEGRKCEYLWTFGDGLSQIGEKVEHIYKYMGDYNVVLNGTCAGIKSVSRTTVKVLVPSLSIVQKADGAVEISNQGKYEINLYGWKIKSANQEYVFPLDTIISAGKVVTFPTEYLKIALAGGEIILADSTDKSVVQVQSQSLTFANNSDRVITVADFERFAMEYKRLTSVNSSTRQLAIPAQQLNGLTTNLPASLTNDGKKQADVSPTASVISAIMSTTSLRGSADTIENGSAQSDWAEPPVPVLGFWNKFFHPIRTIREAFYK